MINKTDEELVEPPYLKCYHCKKRLKKENTVNSTVVASKMKFCSSDCKLKGETKWIDDLRAKYGFPPRRVMLENHRQGIRDKVDAQMAELKAMADEKNKYTHWICKIYNKIFGK